MNQETRTGRRQFLAQGGAVAFGGCAALQAVLAQKAAAQDATPDAATPVSAAPGADCAGQEQVEQNLAAFDRVDFEAWNDRDWDLCRELHAEDVVVTGVGQPQMGIEAHLEWAKAFLAQNAEVQITAHPIRIGSGDWTAVTGLDNNGSTMATIARWENGQIAEEHLFFQLPG